VDAEFAAHLGETYRVGAQEHLRGGVRAPRRTGDRRFRVPVVVDRRPRALTVDPTAVDTR
jgi:hypothetical protein